MSNKNLGIIIGAVILLGAAGALAYYTSGGAKKDGTETKMTQDSVNKDAMMEDDKDGMMKEEDRMMDRDAMMKKEGSYQNYSAAAVTDAQSSGNKVVLFFHAQWCPECRAADSEFKSHPELIPAGITLLKVDYDSNPDLKKKYGVTYQHTFVQIDNSGNMVTKWVSGDISLLSKNTK